MLGVVLYNRLNTVELRATTCNSHLCPMKIMIVVITILILAREREIKCHRILHGYGLVNEIGQLKQAGKQAIWEY